MRNTGGPPEPRSATGLRAAAARGRARPNPDRMAVLAPGGLCVDLIGAPLVVTGRLASLVGNHRIGPGPADEVLDAHHLVDRILERFLREQRGQSDRRIHDRRAQGDTLAERGNHPDLQRLGLVRQVQIPFHVHARRRAGHAEVVGMRHPVLDRGAGTDLVEREALAEDVAEVEGDAARKRLQTEHADQLPDPGFDAHELSVLRLQRDVAGEGGEIQRRRRAAPAQPSLEPSAAALDAFGQLELGEVGADISHRDQHVHARRRVRRPRLPRAGHADPALGAVQVELLDAPNGAVGDSPQDQAAELALAHAKVVRRHIQRRQAAVGIGIRWRPAGPAPPPERTGARSGPRGCPVHPRSSSACRWLRAPATLTCQA